MLMQLSSQLADCFDYILLMNIQNYVVKLCLVELFMWLLQYISFNELWIDTVF